MSAQPPRFLELVPEAPPVLDQVIKTCLAKDPAERFQTAHDLLLQLRWLSGGSGATAGGPIARPARRGVGRLAIASAFAATAIVTGAGTWLMSRPAPPAPRPVIRALLDLPSKRTFGPFGSANLAIAPDGTRLVYIAADEGGASMFVRDLSRFDPGTMLPGTSDALMPFFSPDGTWIGFYSGNRLRKMSVSGGPSTVVCEGTPYGAVWGADDAIVFADSLKGVLVRVSAAGGTPTPVTQLEAGETGHRWPSLLPDGSILFTANLGTNWSESRIVVQPAGGGPRKTVLEGGTFARYLTSGHLAFVRNAALLVVPFDATTLTTTGQPVQVADSLTSNEGDGRVQLAVSASGTLVYAVSPQSAAGRTLVWVDRDGRTEPLALQPRAYEHPRLSPDGRSLAVAIRDANPDVWLADLQRQTLTRFTFEPAEDESPVWTPDGKRITFAATRAGKPRSTYWKAADNSGVEEPLFTTKTHQHLAGWTPDGQTLISEEMETTFGIYRARIGDAAAVPIIQTPFTEVGAHVSPDGKWIAYSSNESGAAQVFVQAFPAGGSRIQISTSGGSEPRWARSGRELFYRHGDQMFVVPIEYTPTLRPGTSRALFEGAYARIGWGQANYDVSLDGRRLLMIKGQDEALPTQLRIVVNWLDELRNGR
jgi:serine/threonine-protein kinase